MNYVIAYDLGTGGCKASLVSELGSVEKSVFVPYLTYFPREDWQEQSPERWWDAIVDSTKGLLSQSAIEPQQIKSLAISGHSLGVVPIGRDGSLLRDTTPIWSDQRAGVQSKEFFSRVDYDQWYLRTGCGFPAPCYSVFKIMWYRDNEPAMYSQIDKVIGTKDYCNFRLTGNIYTDYSYASGTGVYDLEKWSYDDEYIAASQIDRSLFPEIVSSDAVMGYVTAEAALQTGLCEGTAVVCGGVDNSCMALGAKGICSGRTYTSLGSSAWIAAIDTKPIVDLQYKPYVFAHVLKGMYTSALCIFSAGSSLQWVRNNMFADLMEAEQRGDITSSYDQISEMASRSTIGAHGLIFNPSLAGGSSLEPSPSISGAFVGMRLSHNREDIARATMEGISLNLNVAFKVLRKFSPEIQQMLIVGGGAKSMYWMQLFSDIYGVDILKTNIDQMAATIGAAALAFNGIGLWDGYSIIDSLHQDQALYTPDSATTLKYEALLERFNEVTNVLSKINDYGN